MVIRSVSTRLIKTNFHVSLPYWRSTAVDLETGRLLNQFFSWIYSLSTGARMAKWWEHSPPANVIRVCFPDPGPNVGWVFWFSTLNREIFSRNSFFPSPKKTAFDLICVNYKFQFIVSPINAPAPFLYSSRVQREKTQEIQLQLCADL